MVSRHNLSPQDDLKRFDQLDQALIDASSIIYIDKAGFLGILAAAIGLYSIQEVMSETGPVSERIQAVSHRETSASNDQKLISCAINLNLALISEDKKILMAMKRANRSYFNSLMMLNFLLYRRQISKQQYERYHMELKKIARYSEKVWQYGASVMAAVNNK